MAIVNQTLAPEVTANILSYAKELPASVAQGNAVAIIIALILFFVLIIIINTLSTFILSFLKRTILFLIILLVIYDLFPKYLELVSAQGLTVGNIIIGVLGIIACGFGFYLALKSFVKNARSTILDVAARMQKKEYDKHNEVVMKKEQEEMKKQSDSLKEGFSKQAISNEKSLLAVLVYLVVAQFGVFSSPTLSAPNVQVGIMFFLIFLVGIIIFTNSSYKSLKVGMTYFLVTFIAALVLSFTLGVLWGKNTLPQLLSPEFFTSDSLVAMITGMGVSLFAGSKG